MSKPQYDPTVDNIATLQRAAVFIYTAGVEYRLAQSTKDDGERRKHLLMATRSMAAAMGDTEEAMFHVVTEASDAGLSWKTLGRALNTTYAAAHNRYRRDHEPGMMAQRRAVIADQLAQELFGDASGPEGPSLT